MLLRSGSTFWSHRIVLVIVGVVFALLISGLAPTIGFAQQADNAVQPAALNQINALLAEKAARTTTEQKIDSKLLYAFKRASGAPLSAAAAALRMNVPTNAQGATVVDITAAVDDTLLNRIAALGGKILSAYPEYRSVRVAVPLSQLITIASWPQVRFIQPARQAMTAARRVQRPTQQPVPGTDVTSTTAPTSQAALGAATQALASTYPLNRSEGDIAHRVDQLRRVYGYTGAGVKVCVLSDGVDALGDLQTSGDLPAVTIVSGQAGTGNEGAAMLEIVHDLAPNAQLFYATAFSSLEGFATNIKKLRSTYHCDIIVDDVAYFVESPFQLGQTPNLLSDTNGGLIAQAVNEVVADGALYFSAAGNSGNRNDGTSGVWEGNFVAGGAVAAPIPGTGQLLNFDPGNTNRTYNTVTQDSTGPVTLFWADPLGGSSNDYDLFLLDSSGSTLVDASTNLQTGTQDPFEATSVPSTGERIVVVRRSGVARYLQVNTNRGRLQFATTGQTGGHAAAVGGFDVAAADVQNPPVVFSASTVVETFSSDGPRRYFFNPNGTPITPGDFSATGGAVLQKPDLTAADGVSCAAPGFTPFNGTSAAAPHAAAIAALLRSAQPTLTNAQLRTLLTSAPGAIDIEASGVDRDSGAGVLDAFAAMQTLNPSAVPLLSLGELHLGEGTLSNHNGVIESGETFSITVALSNTTLAAATNLQVALALDNPPAGVQVLSPGPIHYGALPSGGAFRNTAQPFVVALAPVVPCGVTLNFKITATYGGSGGNSPQVFLANLTTGAPLLINTTLDTAAPAVPFISQIYNATTGTQIGRLRRDGVTASCSASKSMPGLFTTTGSRQYDAYTFVNPLAEPTCVAVTLSTPENGSTAANGLIATAYGAGGFNAADPRQNYLADPGTSPSPQTPLTFSFLAPASQATTIVVNEVDPSGGIGTGLGDYTLRVAGKGFAVCAVPPAQPASIIDVAGSGQSTPISTTLPITLQTLVKDTAGQPLPGLGVRFSAPTSGTGGVFAGNSTTVVTLTNASGVATAPPFTANGMVGSYQVKATVVGYPAAGNATFVLTNTLDPINAPAIIITPTSGSGQSTPISTTFPILLQALVKDTLGHVQPNLSVTFTTPISGASGLFPGGVATIVIQTDASGVATAPAFTANKTLGSYVVLASTAASSTTARFVLTNSLGLPVTLTATAGSGQNAAVSTTFATLLQATVKDVAGNLLPNISVTFTAPISGSTGSFAGNVTTYVTRTNASGIATAPPFTANGKPGNYTVLARTPGIDSAASFALVNLAENTGQGNLNRRIYLPVVVKGSP